MNTTLFEFLMGFAPKAVRKWFHFWKKTRIVEMKMRDMEFLRVQLQEVREGFRMDYDRMKESRDVLDHYGNLIKKVGMEKASEIVKLGPEKTQEAIDALPKSYNANANDNEALKNIKAKWDQYNTDMAQLEKQMSDIDGQIDSLNEKVKGFRSVTELLKSKKI